MIKIPPHDELAEASVLGAILLDKDALIEVVELLKPDFFYREKHGEIFAAIQKLFEERSPVDLVTLTSELKKNGRLREVGGAQFLSELAAGVPTSANIKAYARIVADCHTKRRLIASGAKITESAFDEQYFVRDLLDKAEAEIFAISQSHIRRDFVHIRETLTESFDRLDALQKKGGGMRGITTGFNDLDKKLSGLQPSNLIILAARPGQGKTAFVLNVAQNISIREKLPVGIFSLEMSKEELVDRLLVAQADIDAWRLKTGRLSESDFEKLSQAMGDLSEAPIFIDDTPGLNILEMRTKARRLQVEHGISLVIVDYLQLVDPGRRFDNRVAEVSFVSQALKNLARELKLPVLAVSQLSRAVESRGSRRPQLADLRESGAIEQDADVVIFIYREENENEGWSDRILTKLLIAKHRNGPMGELDLLFRGDRIKFFSVESKLEASALD